MTIELRQLGDTPSTQQISDLQSSIGLTLPPAYRVFLSKFSGAVPYPNRFQISDKNSSGINQFIPVEKIAYEAGLIGPEVPPKFLPFAYCEGGNYLCVSLNGTDARSVFFFDHELPGESAFTKLAPNIDVFLEELQPFEISSVSLEPGQVKKVWVNPNFKPKF